MINTQLFYEHLLNKDMDFFVGVPDSLLKNFCSCINEHSAEKNIIAANEGNAVAISAGYHLATNKYGVVYMQNSGLGNCINPFLSLTDEEVYNVPMLLIIGWRGEPGVKDEPQHIKQGELTIPLLKTIGIEYLILDNDYEKQINYCYEYMQKHNKPIALIVKKNTFNEFEINKEKEKYTLTREDALKIIIDNLTDDDFIVSTTGKTSREIFEIREQNNQSHANDFLTVGSMGHTSSIALGMSLGTENNVYCVDGDGSFIMHMGGVAISAKHAKENLKYILINNGAHESVGGQPTIGFDIDTEKTLKSFGFNNVEIAYDESDIKSGLSSMQQKGVNALVVYTKQGSRKDLGRPTITPQENKKSIMKKIKK